MSRIEEALRRIAGGSAEPRRTSGLEGYAPEKGYQPEDSRGPAPVFPSGPVRVEAKPPVSQPVAVPPPIVHAQPDQAEESESPADAEKLIDFRPIADYGRFVGASVWRHKLLTLATFSLVLGLTAALTILLPKTYSAETKLLAQRNEVMAALSNPGRAIPWDADAPTRAASETVLRRDNLIALIRETDLVNEWKRTRVPVLRLKDWVMSFMRPPLTQAEQIDQLVGMLEARIVVQAGPVGDGTVTISLTWPDAQMAYRLVQAAQRSFIDARQVAERTAIGESIGILERYSATLHENINNTLAELQRTQAKGRASSGRGGTAVARIPESIPMATEITAGLPEAPDLTIGIPGLGADRNDPEIPRLRESLASRRQEIATLEEQRQHQLSDLQAQLARLTAVYTPAHPMVLSTQQHIAALSQDSPQLAALKSQADSLDSDYKKRVNAVAELEQVEQLKTEYANRTQATNARPAHPQAPRTVPDAPVPTGNAPGSGDMSDFASIRLRLELNQLESVLERTDGARIELAVSDAAFKYRYSVIRPPQVPLSPIRPNLRLIVIAGIVGSLLLAVAAAVGKDMLSDRIFERWQIERHLGLPILGTLGTA